MSQRYTITTAISYPNGAPHIGHAYELIATDAIARFKRLDGYKVHFSTGTDEHGQKMVETAAKEGIPVAELADRNTAAFRRMAEVLGSSHDDFISTREPRHIKASQVIWQKMAEAGDIYLGNYGGWYSVRDEAFFGENEITEQDGQKLAPTGAPGDLDGGAVLLLPPVRLPGPPARALRGASGFHRPRHAAQRGRGVREVGPQGPLHFPHHDGLGRAGAGRPGPRDVRVGGRADQLHHVLRLPGRAGALRGVVAGGPARHRQGHHPLPHHLLAGVPDERGAGAPQARLRPRLPLQCRREDE